jgi:hypothetical protein
MLFTLDEVFRSFLRLQLSSDGKDERNELAISERIVAQLSTTRRKSRLRTFISTASMQSR